MIKTSEAAQMYRDAGWIVPIPLPSGKKFPPSRYTTGGIAPEIAKKNALEAWDDANDHCNLALRMQTELEEWDILSVDVDDYDEKTGGQMIQDLQSKLGDLRLRETIRSTRRGVDNVSAQYLFRVPKGHHWIAKIGDSIEMVQMTHRYTVAWPSQKDGEVYRWYRGDEEIDIPTPMDALEMPERWLRHLRHGAQKEFSDGTEVAIVNRRDSDLVREGFEWLRENVPAFGQEDSVSESIRRAADYETLTEEMDKNAHDTLLTSVRKVVRFGYEGHPGMKLGLQSILETFIEATGSRQGEGYRTEYKARQEFGRALVDEIEKIAREGKKVVDTTKAEPITAYRKSLSIVEEPDKPKDFDLSDVEFGDTDAGNARLFVDYWGGTVRPTNENGSQEFAVWTPAVGRYVFRSKNRMYQLLEKGCAERIDVEAEKVAAAALNLEAAASAGQLPSDAEDPEKLSSMADNLKARAARLRNTVNANRVIAQLHSHDDIAMEVGDFDSKGHLIGLKGAETLDMHALKAGKSPVRKSTQDDFLTMTTGTKYIPGNKHAGWTSFLDKFLPDKEIQEFVQKILGYCLFDGNPYKLLIFLIGPSNTGKTTILEAVAAALGDYASNMNANKLFGKNDGGPSPEFVSNAQKLMVYLSEVGNTHRLSADTIKQVTGGDSVQARNLYSNDTHSRTVRFTPYISTNTTPQIEGGDAALLDRVVAIPFQNQDRSIPDFDMDVKNNPEIYPAIMSWLVEGAAMVRDDGGLVRPEAVVKAGREFMGESSLIQSFLSDCTEPISLSDATIGVEKLFVAWKQWCHKNEIDKRDVGNRKDFETALRGLFRVKEGRRRTTVDGKNGYVYAVALKEVE